MWMQMKGSPADSPMLGATGSEGSFDHRNVYF